MTINESLHRILEQRENLANLFYFTIFFDENPEVRPYFEKVNMRHQPVLLTMVLMVIVNHYINKYPATELYLRYLGSKHKDRQIPPELYPKFRSALLATLERFHGPDWDKGLSEQWQAAIDLATQIMLEGYKEHFIV